MQQDDAMEIKKIKNLIGKCACADCSERPTVYITLQVRKKDGRVRTKKSFFVCPDHAADLSLEYNKK